MCGIGGVIRPDTGPPVDELTLRRMAAATRHRGPDGFGLARTPGAGLVSTRLAIFDIPGGWQPLATGEGTAMLVYNGEVYNHPELRAELEARGERFATTCDTEVVLRLLVRDGLGALERLNGQFAAALWEPAPRRLTMIRDRFGVRPLHFSLLADGTLVFASEAKGIFASGLVAPEPDPAGLDQIFTFWGPRPPRTAFRGVSQLRPGAVLIWERGEIVADRYWWTAEMDPGGVHADPGELDELMRESVGLRLRADVPVGSYLSGGLDSSLITALAQEATSHQLRTFSIAFTDALYDERSHQEEVAQAIGTDHHVLEIGTSEIAGALPEVIRHTETPLVRTAPVPMFLLAREVRAQGITVVATGEGADELFWGYDLFKEVVLREIAQTDPQRAGEMLDRLYGYLGAPAARRGPGWKRFMLAGDDLDAPLASHQTRIRSTAAIKAFYDPGFAAALGDADSSLIELRADLPASFAGWPRLQRAAWLELRTLLDPYLLSAQGDRVAMASGVEGRYPFLDHRVFEYSARLAPTMKLDQLRDKVVLRDLAERVLPASIAGREKQPYRAPGVAPFFGAGAPAWVEEALTPEALGDASVWDPARVSGLLRRCRQGRVTSPREEMSLVAVLSTQVWHRTHIREPAEWEPESAPPRVRIERGLPASERAPTA